MRDEAARVQQLLTETGAHLEGHFVLTSGRHSREYFQCARVLEDPKHAEELGGMLAGRFAEDRPDVVVAPALGGMIIGYEVARALGVRFLFTERKDGFMTLRRGFALGPDDRVVIIEDVVTTGGSVREVAGLVKEAGATLLGFGFIVHRGPEDLDLGARAVGLIRKPAKSHAAEDCPLCAEGAPVVKPGSRT